MADTFFTISILSFILSGICLALAVFFWFRFGILEVIGNLSGRTARKNVEKLRASNEKTGAKPISSTKKAQEKTNISKMPVKSVKIDKMPQIESPVDYQQETGLLAENQTVLKKETQTDLLAWEVTGELMTDETSVLVTSGKVPVLQGQQIEKKCLTMLDDLIVLHTEEEIR